MRRVWAGLVAFWGPDERVLACGLICLTVGLWSVVGAAALVVPGAVLTWLALPSRHPLIHRPPERRVR